MKALFVSAALLASSAFAAAAPSLTGQWTIHNSVAGNESDQVCKFVQTDNKITGTCKGADNDVPVNGTVDGNKATWKYDMDYNGTPLTLTYTATLDDSGKVAGSVEVQPFGVSGDFTATPLKGSSK
jgi:opacity protein-like surface antigen